MYNRCSNLLVLADGGTLILESRYLLPSVGGSPGLPGSQAAEPDYPEYPEYLGTVLCSTHYVIVPKTAFTPGRPGKA